LDMDAPKWCRGRREEWGNELPFKDGQMRGRDGKSWDLCKCSCHLVRP
jgi:hypothetical protein